MANTVTVGTVDSVTVATLHNTVTTAVTCPTVPGCYDGGGHSEHITVQSLRIRLLRTQLVQLL